MPLFPTSTKPYLPRLMVLWLVCATFLCPASLFAQDFTNEDVQKISVGFSDSVRLGHWAPITVSFVRQLPQSSRPAKFEITCLDGEGAPVTYRGNLDYDEAHPSIAQAWFRMGRKTSDIRVELVGGNENNQQAFELVADKDFAVTSSTTKTVLAIESDERLREIIDVASQNAGGGRVIQNIESISHLPINSLGYQGVDKIFLSTSAKSIDQISDLQINALKQWVQYGGNLIFSVGQGGESLIEPSGRLAGFCPGTFNSVVQRKSASRLESYSDSESSLIGEGETLPVAEITITNGMIRLSQEGTPIITQEARGFGTITFVAVDIASELFHNWDGIDIFVKKLFFGTMESAAVELKNIAGGRVSHYGYDDLVGQLRVPLDQFTSVRFVTFTWVAVLIGLYILCIGPGDYFLLRKVFGRMEFTWLTFGFMTLAFCGIAWLMARTAKPNRVQINQLEIIDVDAVSGRTRGFVWANIFSPSTTTHDVALASTNQLGHELESSVLTWQGLPGEGLGGMQSSSNTTLVTEGYAIDVETNASGAKTTLKQFPVRVSSSKPVFARWTANNVARPQSNLRYNERIQQLEGTLTNPFDHQLTNCRVLFENWVYVKVGTLGPGETIDLRTETREKNARSYFARRYNKGEKATNAAWDPTDTKTTRIADMMMFYETAGGKGYIGLTHSYQGFTDLSQIPHLNRAILVGELEEQTTEIFLDGEAKSDGYDYAVTLLRVVLPVARGSKK